MLSYKKITVADYAEELYRMDVSAFNRPFDLPSRSAEESASYLEGCEVYFGYAGNTPVGLVAYKKHLGRVEVKQVLVLPQFQKKGYGTLLFRHMLETIGRERIWLVTHPKNTPAILLYLKEGFRISGWHDNYYGDGQPRLLLEKG